MTYDTQHLLNYTFKNSRGFVKTANLEVVYNKFKNKSDINAVYYYAFKQWSNAFLNKIKNFNIKPTLKSEDSIFVKCLLYFIREVYHIFNYSHGSIQSGLIAKEDIEYIIKKYHQTFDSNPIYIPPLIDSSKVPMPVVQKEIKFLYHSYIERIPYLRHKKGYRGFVRDYDYIPHYAPASNLPELLETN